MNPYLRYNSTKKSSVFAVRVSNTMISKQEAFEVLKELCSQLLIAEEKHYDGRAHFHLYLKTIKKYSCDEIKDVIRIVFANEDDETGQEQGAQSSQEIQIHVETVRCEIRYLRYITKQDCKPLIKGIPSERLSFYYQSIEWAENTPTYRAADPFVLSHPQYYRLLSEVHYNVHREKRASSLRRLRPILYVVPEHLSWQDEIVLWWNDFVVNGHEHKKKQLFLYGESNVGKTFFVNQLLANCINSPDELDRHHPNYDFNRFQAQTFKPTPNDFKFAWQSFSKDEHNVVYIDEFDITEYNVADFKKAIAGETFITNVKGAKSLLIEMTMPMIFLSNYKIPEADFSNKYKGIKERLHIIYADRLIL